MNRNNLRQYQYFSYEWSANFPRSVRFHSSKQQLSNLESKIALVILGVFHNQILKKMC